MEGTEPLGQSSPETKRESELLMEKILLLVCQAARPHSFGVKVKTYREDVLGGLWLAAEG